MNRAVRIAHRPALDGLRGVAVAAVLVFHADVGLLPGGFLGVSAFFTLSGFLITTLLLREHRAWGTIALRDFWARRVRRLLPAALVGLTLALGYAMVEADGGQLASIRADIVACIGYVANWRFIWSDRSYDSLFVAPSPVQHFWSLAVEEQFYLFLPLGVAALARLRRDLVTTVGIAAVIGIGASVATTLALRGPTGAGDRLYYGTDTRAAELLVGVALAALVEHRRRHRAQNPSPPTALRRRLGRRALAATGAASAGAIVALWATADTADAWLYPGGLLVHALATAAVIAAAIGSGRLAGLLALAPLRLLGRISYALYVVHWPVFLVLDERRLGWDPWPTFALRAVVSIALATASTKLIEDPVRRAPALDAGAPIRRRPTIRPSRTGPGWTRADDPAAAAERNTVLALTASMFVIVGALSLAFIDRAPAIDLATAEARLARASRVDLDAPDGATDGAADRAPRAASSTATGTAATGPLRIVAVGDSLALTLSYGMDLWGQDTGRLRLRGTATPIGCPLVPGGSFDYLGFTPVPDRCDWATEWPAVLADTDATVAMVMIGTWDQTERVLPGTDEVVAIGDPAYDDRLRASIAEASALLLRDVETVVWFTLPVPVADTAEHATSERTARFNEILSTTVPTLVGDVRVLDFGAWLDETAPDDLDLRPDGTHFSLTSSRQAGAWAGPALVDLLAART